MNPDLIKNVCPSLSFFSRCPWVPIKQLLTKKILVRQALHEAETWQFLPHVPKIYYLVFFNNIQLGNFLVLYNTSGHTPSLLNPNLKFSFNKQVRIFLALRTRHWHNLALLVVSSFFDVAVILSPNVILCFYTLFLSDDLSDYIKAVQQGVAATEGDTARKEGTDKQNQDQATSQRSEEEEGQGDGNKALTKS